MKLEIDSLMRNLWLGAQGKQEAELLGRIQELCALLGIDVQGGRTVPRLGDHVSIIIPLRKDPTAANLRDGNGRFIT